MLLQLIRTDNDSGHAGARMGRGPEHILAEGFLEQLRARGHRAEVVRAETRSAFPTEVASAFAVAEAISGQVRVATRQKRFPVVLAGNCFASVGVVAGLSRRRTGIVWLDAHADLHTPETTRSGFLDGMALATAAGCCWGTCRDRVPGFRPVDAEHILLIGARDIDPEEARLAEELRIARFPPAGYRADAGAACAAAIAALGSAVDRIHLHLDVDVFDPDAVAPANAFASPGGLLPDEVVLLVRQIRCTGRLAAVTVASFDPAFDPADVLRPAVRSVLDVVLA